MLINKIKLPEKISKSVSKIVNNILELDKDNIIDCILLFGSYANGTYQPHSDLDLCLVVKELPNRSTRNKFYSAEDELNIDVDYIICTKDMLKKNIQVYKYINDEGVIIYGQL